MAGTQDIAELELRIRLTRDARNKLAERANCIGRPLDDYASELLELAASAPTAVPGKDVGVPSSLMFDRALDEFFAANPEKLPALPSDFSRDDIYADHD